MDDYARTLYMEALKEVKKGKNPLNSYLCNELRKILWREGFEIGPMDIETIFHHFSSLKDGKLWTKDQIGYINENKKGAWWEGDMIEPRIRILNFLLTER